VGGARTLAELSDTLLAARYDVRKFSTVELMRWDYKELVRHLGGAERGGESAAAAEGGSIAVGAAAAEGGSMAMGAGAAEGGSMAVGIAAICETIPELIARSGGAAGLEKAMAEASERRGGLGLLLALTKEDDTQGGCKGIVALLPPSAAADSGPSAASAEAAALLEALSGVLTLPAALSSNALFTAQSIEQEGFGIRWEAVTGAPRLRLSSLRSVATRKTLMPAVLQLGTTGTTTNP
jgi:hypothetical protein